MNPVLSIKIVDGNHPDTQESCKVLEINGLVVPFWIDTNKLNLIEEKINKDNKNIWYIQLMNSFLGLVEKCINRKLTLSQLMSAVESGTIEAGPPPEQK